MARQFAGAADIRAICPFCNLASTFAIRTYQHDSIGGRLTVYLLLRCNSARCQKTLFVKTSFRDGLTHNEATDEFFMFPSRAISPSHASIPTNIAEDWQEAQRAMQAIAPKAAAVMLRRVLYGTLIDKNCKLHPISDGLKQLIAEQRLPAVFDDWLTAIKDDGHDGAHPDRALQVSIENINETFEYTAELLRYLYIEPYEFQVRKARNIAVTPTTA